MPDLSRVEVHRCHAILRLHGERLTVNGRLNPHFLSHFLNWAASGAERPARASRRSRSCSLPDGRIGESLLHRFSSGRERRAFLSRWTTASAKARSADLLELEPEAPDDALLPLFDQ
jgi:hypothetical protein